MMKALVTNKATQGKEETMSRTPPGESFPRPGGGNWAVFERAATRVVLEWDVVDRVVEEHEDGEGEEEAAVVLDDLLYNFAERWTSNRSATVDSVETFFVEAFDEHFGAEVDASVVFPVAKLLVTLFEECKRGVVTGATHVVEHGPYGSRARSVEPVTAADGRGGEAMEDVEEGSAPSALPPSAAPAQPPNQVPGAPEASLPAQASGTPGGGEGVPDEDPTGPDADGWETVTSSKSKRKNKGKALTQG